MKSTAFIYGGIEIFSFYNDSVTKWGMSVIWTVVVRTKLHLMHKFWWSQLRRLVGWKFMVSYKLETHYSQYVCCSLSPQTDRQLDCALDLMRRLPPQQIEKNLSDLIDLVSDLIFAEDKLELCQCVLISVGSWMWLKNLPLCDL